MVSDRGSVKFLMICNRMVKVDGLYFAAQKCDFCHVGL